MKLNNISKILVLTVFTSLLFSCVPQRKHVELQDKYNALNLKNTNLDLQYNNLKAENEKVNKELEDLKNEHSRLLSDYKEKEALYDRVKKSYDQLTGNYEKLIQSESKSKDELRRSLRELENKLQKKELELNKKEANLIRKEEEAAKLNKSVKSVEESLKDREAKIKELEDLIRKKEENVENLKQNLSKALLGYKDNGLTVTSKNGKVYVSVDENLLFKSGKTDVNPNGKKALLKMSETLKKNMNFDIVVEGHTDNVPIKTARFDDNWDLSVLRATSITRMMISEGGIDPLKIIPSGRGEYFPIDSADTKEARAKNRRIEIIITPGIDEIMKILNK